MKIGLFIPCYVDTFYPKIGIACYQILQQLGCDVFYPTEQTCCGQPLGNSGFEKNNTQIENHFYKNFHQYDYIVAPSGSCVLYVKEHYHLEENKRKELADKTFEFCDFLLNVLKITEWKTPLSFPHKVAIHNSCHAHRGLHLGNPTELKQQPNQSPSIAESMLAFVPDIQIVQLDYPDECCGFGGTFSVFEEAVSVKMGEDRLQDHIKNGVEVITGLDASCLMHLEGLIKRKKYNLKVKHVLEIMNNEQMNRE